MIKSIPPFNFNPSTFNYSPSSFNFNPSTLNYSYSPFSILQTLREIFVIWLKCRIFAL